MTEFRYGPVEMYLVGYSGDGPDAATFAALADLIDADIVRVLDLVLVSKDDDGRVEAFEVEDVNAFGLGGELAASGIAGAEDIETMADAMPPGTTAALLVLEMLYARELARSVAASGGVVLVTERIPAPIVNAVVELAEEIDAPETETPAHVQA